MVAIDLATWDAKQAARERYDERQRNEQKHPRGRRKSSNRAIGLDNRSSANGVNTSRARRVVETVGNLALEWTADEYSFSVSEEMFSLFTASAGHERDYERDAHNTPAICEGAYRLRLGGEIYRVSISAPYPFERRWRTVVTFDDMPGNVKFAVTLAQLVAVLDIAPTLSIVPKSSPATPPTWEPSASALRWTACMIGAAGCMSDEVYDLSRCPAAVADTSGLFRIVAGYVIEI